MIIQRKRGLQAVLVLCQGILITVVFVLCALGTFNFFTSISWGQIIHYPIYIFAITSGLFFESFRRDQAGVELSPFKEGFPRQHQLSVRQTIYAIGALFIYLIVTKDGTISRIFLGLCVPMFYLTLLLSNRYLSRRLASYLFSGVRKGRVLLIGPVTKALLLRQWLKSKAIFGIQAVGILNDTPNDMMVSEEFPHLGSATDIEAVIKKENVTQVILLELPDSPEAYRKMMAALDRQGVRLLILNNLEEKLHHPVWYMEDDGHYFLGLRREPLENPLHRISKRLLDIFVALPIVLFVLPPVALMVWFMQKMHSPGPVILRQMRAGLQNNQFEILKFRTMHVHDTTDTRQASKHDDRIYRGGRILRQLSLDELPQFWNVLQGNMSVVGPRPHLIEHNEQFASVIANFPIRMVVKPGITGLAQVRGFRGEARTPESIAHRLQSDIEYMENWRLTLDILIIIRTALQMIVPPKTAY